MVCFRMLTLAVLVGGAAFAQSGDLDLPVAPPRAEPDGTPPILPDPIDPELPPPTFFGTEIPTEGDSIVYVLDTSGSMNSDRQSYTRPDGTQGTGTRIERAKAELVRSISGLSENFEFNVIAYDCGSYRWQPGLVEASPGNKTNAAAWVTGRNTGGATGTGPASALALGTKENLTVVLLTDGAPNCGASGTQGHRRLIQNANTQRAAIHVFGIAAAGSYRSFCQDVARENDGIYVDVP